jgi:hypothetical protein
LGWCVVVRVCGSGQKLRLRGETTVHRVTVCRVKGVCEGGEEEAVKEEVAAERRLLSFALKEKKTRRNT